MFFYYISVKSNPIYEGNLSLKISTKWDAFKLTYASNEKIKDKTQAFSEDVYPLKKACLLKTKSQPGY